MLCWCGWLWAQGKNMCCVRQLFGFCFVGARSMMAVSCESERARLRTEEKQVLSSPTAAVARVACKRRALRGLRTIAHSPKRTPLGACLKTTPHKRKTGVSEHIRLTTLVLASAVSGRRRSTNARQKYGPWTPNQKAQRVCALFMILTCEKVCVRVCHMSHDPLERKALLLLLMCVRRWLCACQVQVGALAP